MQSAQYLRRKEAGEYLKNKYGFGSAKTLAKLACVSSNGPLFHKAGSAALYKPADLDEWALAKISAPVRSTSEQPEVDE